MLDVNEIGGADIIPRTGAPVRSRREPRAAEQVALDYAEAITRSDLEVDDALTTRVKENFDDEITKLTALIAFLEPVEQVQRRARGGAPGLLPAAA